VLQAYLGDAPSRRIRRLRRLSAEERQRETEALISLYLSFPIDELLPKERPLLLGSCCGFPIGPCCLFSSRPSSALLPASSGSYLYLFGFGSLFHFSR
jgi:hypothetical protein